MNEAVIYLVCAIAGASFALLCALLAPRDGLGAFRSYSEIEHEQTEILKNWVSIALVGALFGILSANSML